MAKIEAAFFDVSYLDTLSRQDTVIHRLDPRAKLITTLIFIMAVVSFDKYAISGLLPFFIFPVFFTVLGNLPVNYLLKKILLVAPFAFFIGVFNPFFDQQVIMQVGPFNISGGWISFLSILLRFTLTVGSVFILIATSGFLEICLALEKLKVPKAFVVQLLFLYRYIFVLIDEAIRLIRARSLRAFGNKGMGIRVAGSLIGHLLLRTLDRARRIYLAMLCRGFDGEIRLSRPFKFAGKDLLFILLCSAAVVIMRLINLPELLGTMLMGIE